MLLSISVKDIKKIVHSLVGVCLDHKEKTHENV